MAGDGLGFLEGGVAPRTSIAVGGYQIEDNLLQFDLAASRLGFSSSLLFSRPPAPASTSPPLLETRTEMCVHCCKLEFLIDWLPPFVVV